MSQQSVPVAPQAPQPSSGGGTKWWVWVAIGVVIGTAYMGFQSCSDSGDDQFDESSLLTGVVSPPESARPADPDADYPPRPGVGMLLPGADEPPVDANVEMWKHGASTDLPAWSNPG